MTSLRQRPGRRLRLGDFDGDGRTDVVWYAPGTAANSIWLARGAIGFVHVEGPVGGYYQPVTGELDGDGLTTGCESPRSSARCAATTSRS